MHEFNAPSGGATLASATVYVGDGANSAGTNIGILELFPASLLAGGTGAVNAQTTTCQAGQPVPVGRLALGATRCCRVRPAPAPCSSHPDRLPLASRQPPPAGPPSPSAAAGAHCLVVQAPGRWRCAPPTPPRPAATSAWGQGRGVGCSLPRRERLLRPHAPSHASSILPRPAPTQLLCRWRGHRTNCHRRLHLYFLQAGQRRRPDHRHRPHRLAAAQRPVRLLSHSSQRRCMQPPCPPLSQASAISAPVLPVASCRPCGAASIERPAL